jgi:hypothetical protein
LLADRESFNYEFLPNASLRFARADALAMKQVKLEPPQATNSAPTAAPKHPAVQPAHEPTQSIDAVALESERGVDYHNPLLSLSGRAIARSLMRQSIQAMLLEKRESGICY